MFRNRMISNLHWSGTGESVSIHPVSFTHRTGNPRIDMPQNVFKLSFMNRQSKSARNPSQPALFPNVLDASRVALFYFLYRNADRSRQNWLGYAPMSRRANPATRMIAKNRDAGSGA